MKTVAIIALAAVALTFFVMQSGHSSTEMEFRTFIDNYSISYGSSDEYSYRLGVFEDNLRKIDELSKLNPQASFGVGIFSDRTEKEMERYMGLKLPSNFDFNKEFKPADKPKSVDWSGMWPKGVKDQKQCGSCWAFSAIATFEGRYHIFKRRTTVDQTFSEQQLVDCVRGDCQGCNGGWMDTAFNYLRTMGLCTDSDYPYQGVDKSCSAKGKCESGPKVREVEDIDYNDEEDVLDELKEGPIAVAVDASTWQHYKSGVITSCGKSINHGVTLVQSNVEDRWVKIRNSWTGKWGENGHIRLAFGGTCGYTMYASYPDFTND